MGFTKIDEKDVDCCDSSTVFMLDNGIDQFAVNLEIMLKCLKFAADQGKIPAIPEDWWNAVSESCDSSLMDI